MTDLDPKCRALAAALKVDPETCEESRTGDVYETESEPGEYRVLTESEREEAAKEALQSYIDECLEIPAHIRPYFDEERWMRDALMSDGYGHTLSPYDGDEHEAQIDGEWFYIYRVN